MATDFRRVRQIFDEVCDLDPEVRATRLDELCAGDVELRAEVAALLAVDEGQTTESRSASDAIREWIGPYRILEPIGEGGMGVVYLAERQEPHKRVALKVIKPGMDSRNVLARFDAERQALAMMNHPNVAAFLDAGVTEDGYPYFVMEHVPGVAITEHCDGLRLGLTERLELFEQVCRGVHHAHQKGVIHRDIKPGNVLVQYRDEVATPKIIDFGVAKALQQPLTRRPYFTAQGQIVGTPEYMSPEQIQLDARDIDTRADIYSLGVLLYELLTGALPFDRHALRAAGIEGMLRLIRDTDPPRPSTRLITLDSTDPDVSTEAARRRGLQPHTLARRLRDDIDWITMMCLEKDRARRYESAAAFADDVRRHLENHVVRARPPSWSYRAAKLFRRHRPAILGATGMVIIGLVALVTVTAVVVGQRRERAELDRLQALELVDQARLLSYAYPDEAQDRLKAALVLQPRLEAAEIEWAYADRRRGRKTEAIARARVVLERNPTSGQAAALLAGLLKKEDAEASRRYAALAESQLAEGELHAALALAEPDPDEALRLLARSLEANPWNFGAVWQRAARRLDVGDVDGALEDAELLVKVRPDLVLTWGIKGAILLHQRQYEPAEACFDRALALGAGGWELRWDLGLTCWDARDYARARQELGRALEDLPASAEHDGNRRKLLLSRVETRVSPRTRPGPMASRRSRACVGRDRSSRDVGSPGRDGGAPVAVGDPDGATRRGCGRSRARRRPSCSRNAGATRCGAAAPRRGQRGGTTRRVRR